MIRDFTRIQAIRLLGETLGRLSAFTFQFRAVGNSRRYFILKNMKMLTTSVKNAGLPHPRIEYTKKDAQVKRPYVPGGITHMIKVFFYKLDNCYDIVRWHALTIRDAIN